MCPGLVRICVGAQIVREVAVGWLGRIRARTTFAGRRSASSSSAPGKQEVQVALAHLKEFVATRRGVEMFVEPRTSVTPTTVVLVATSGEWTRRRVSDPKAAGQLARDLAVPVYDVQQTGYPRRMREWTAAQAQREKN